MESASIAADHAHGHDEHHGPPPANQSSRIEPQLLGMLLFIISEVMLFGAFFTAYFFIRVVADDPWPAEGMHLPVAIAGVNTAILLSSSVTMHWALEGAKRENRAALRIGLLTTFLLGADLPDGPDQRVLPHRLRRQRERAVVDLLRAHRAPRRARLRRPHAAPVRDRPRLPRPLHARRSTAASRCPGIYWHFVDVMWIIVYSLDLHPLINPLRSEREAFQFLLYVGRRRRS